MSLARSVLRAAIWVIVAAFVAMMVFGGVTASTPWPVAGRSFAVSLLFSACIGGLCFAVFSRLGPYLVSRVGQPVYWMGMVATMLVLAAIGSVIALLVLSVAGVLPAGEIMAGLRSSLRISLVVTIAIGVSVTIVETLRGRLEKAQLALRTKERDEAEARRIASEAQLASLESRVQPHFLFNTLNSIAALIPQDPAGAERMTWQLASLLRSSLDGAATPLVPLATELQSVRDYLEIERVRFGERLRYSVEAPAELEQVLVPRLALQTLVENSVKFGVSPRREGGNVRVSTETSSGDARLIVEDDGPGFDYAMAPDHHGLALLRDRLRHSFGERASIDVDSHPGRTRVIVTVPR